MVGSRRRSRDDGPRREEDWPPKRSDRRGHDTYYQISIHFPWVLDFGERMKKS